MTESSIVNPESSYIKPAETKEEPRDGIAVAGRIDESGLPDCVTILEVLRE